MDDEQLKRLEEMMKELELQAAEEGVDMSQWDEEPHDGKAILSIFMSIHSSRRI